MFKNLRIKLLKFQRSYLQGKVLLKKANLLISANSKLQVIGFLLIICFSFIALTYNPTHALENPNRGTEETSNLNFKLADTNNLIQTTLVLINGGYIRSEQGANGGSTVSWQPIDEHGGAMGIVAGATATMYKQGPVGTQQYLAHLGEKAKIGPSPTYAQTTQGFEILRPIIKLWEWSRNLVYVFYVIIFVIIGMMIILRHRIGGQIPITIINSIPSVILSLVLVTFSYAIAGLIIDAMHLTTGIIHAGFFGQGSSIIENIDPTKDYSFQSPQMSVFRIFGTAEVTDFETAFELGEIEGVMGDKVINFVINIIEGVANFNTLVSVVLSIAAVAAMFKIFFTLLIKYLTFMLSPVLAPFQFFLGSIPGKSSAIGSWFKGMISSVAAFVGVYTAFCIMVVLTRENTLGDWTWFPPLTAFSAGRDTIAHLLAYALFISTPNIPGMLDKALQADPASIFGAVGGETKSAISKASLGLFGGR